MKIVQQANKDARNNARAISNVIKRDRKRVEAICRALTKAGVNINYVNIDSSGYNVSITGSRADLDVMFGVLRRENLTPDQRPAEKNTGYCCFWRTEGFKLWVWFTSTSCKRVQVGTKLEEVPVYDTVCEE
jgi:mRNA degradation ribonuclease J1/J2